MMYVSLCSNILHLCFEVALAVMRTLSEIVHQFISHTSFHFQMGYWARPEQIDIGATEWAMAVSQPIIDYFEEYFDEEYAIEKLGIQPILMKHLCFLYICHTSRAIFIRTPSEWLWFRIPDHALTPCSYHKRIISH